MRHSHWCRWLLAGVAAAGCLLAASQPAPAVEESQKFLEALRDPDGRFRYYDTALEYLETMRTSPLADPQFKEVIDYEAGVTLIVASRTAGDRSVRQRQLDRAEQSLKKFVAEHPDHRLVCRANAELADVLRERGRILSDEAVRSSAADSETARLQAEAREMYARAREVLGKLEGQLLQRHGEFPKVIDPREAKLIEARDQVREDLVRARLVLAQVAEEVARTYEPGSRSYVDRLMSAAGEYGEFYKKYHDFLAGLYARMWQGRCYKDAGETAKAIEAFEELLSQPSDPQEFRILRNKAMILLMETTLSPQVRQYQRALEEAQKWEEAARGAEESTTEGLAIKYLAGEAALGYAKTLTERKDADARKKALAGARRYFRFVAGFPGEYRGRAGEAARRPELAGEDPLPPEPTTFAEARDRASDALGRLQGAGVDEDEKAALREEAIEQYRRAIEMRTAEVTTEEINVIRYYLAWLYYVSDDFYSAAVVGEFLAHRYPDGPAARQGARIAMAAYAGLFNAAPPQQRQFETDRVVGLAEYIVHQWQGEPVEAEAWMTLISMALSSGDLEKAQEYLQRVPADSPRRGEIELKTGQRLWAAYLTASRKTGDDRPSQESLDRMLERAQKTLEDGIARMRASSDQGGGVSQTLAVAMLSLAQIYVDTEAPERALRYLEDPKIGPLALAAARHEATSEGNFRTETYKAALRAYVAVQQVDKAREVMKHLEDLTAEGGDADAGKKLTAIYISLGRELQDQLERLRAQQKTEQLAKVSEAFESFLDRIRQGEGNTFNSLNWVAETHSSLAAGFDLGGKILAPEARGNYRKAVDGYQKILERWDDADFGAPAGAVNSVKIRLAKCLRRLGPVDPADYDQAMDLLVDILRDRETVVDAQIEAAYVYQARGEQDARYYPLAIGGGRRFKKKDGSVVNLVWGWGKIARMVATNPKYESIFHEARYNLALCRMKMALEKKGKEKAELLARAETDIRAVFRLYPKMGQGVRPTPSDKDWHEKYDDLLKTIQKLQGKTADGLKGLEARRQKAAA